MDTTHSENRHVHHYNINSDPISPGQSSEPFIYFGTNNHITIISPHMTSQNNSTLSINISPNGDSAKVKNTVLDMAKIRDYVNKKKYWLTDPNGLEKFKIDAADAVDLIPDSTVPNKMKALRDLLKKNYNTKTYRSLAYTEFTEKLKNRNSPIATRETSNQQKKRKVLLNNFAFIFIKIYL